MQKENLGKITKICFFTDIHWGARNNSDLHNQDCLNFVDWFIEDIVKNEKPSHIFFLGDWFENRNSINVRTLKYSQDGARRLNALGIPVVFIIGNHDLYHRSNRQIFSTDQFSDLENFLVVSEPTQLNKDMFAAPYLFRDEYPNLAADINSHKYVFGHFEFRNFIVTGSDRTIEHGPDPAQFKNPKYIFSGHFHKRQVKNNIIYIGNTFPTNYGDAGDSERGAAVFEVSTQDVWFHNWDKAPLFFKTRLTRVLNGEMDWPENARVRCLLDADIGYTEVQALRQEMLDTFKLREFSVEEDLQARKEAISEGLEIEGDVDMTSLNDTVRNLINEGVAPSPTIDPAQLVKIYEELR